MCRGSAHISWEESALVHCPCLLHIKFFVHNLRGPQRKFSILHWEKSWLGNPAMYLHLQEFSSYIRTIWIYCCHCVLVSVLLPEEKRVLRRISFDPLPVHRTLRAQSKRATKKIYPCTFTEISACLPVARKVTQTVGPIAPLPPMLHRPCKFSQRKWSFSNKTLN